MELERERMDLLNSSLISSVKILSSEIEADNRDYKSLICDIADDHYTSEPHTSDLKIVVSPLRKKLRESRKVKKELQAELNKVCLFLESQRKKDLKKLVIRRASSEKKVALKKLEKRVFSSAMDMPWYILPTESPPLIDVPDEEMVTARPLSPDWW